MARTSDATERILKLSIALVVLSFLLAPVIAVIMQLGGNAMLAPLFGRISSSVDNPRTGISSGSDPAMNLALEDKMQALTAHRGEAKGAAKVLQIITAQFDDTTNDAVSADGFRTVALDLVGADDVAVVVITNRPVRWSVTAPKGFRRARFGVESSAPFDLIDVAPGFLSGYRVTPFGADDAATPEQYIDDRDAAAFCKSVGRWRRFYELPRSSVRIAAARNPRTIAVSTYGMSHNGEAVEGLPPIDSFCEGH